MEDVECCSIRGEDNAKSLCLRESDRNSICLEDSLTWSINQWTDWSWRIRSKWPMWGYRTKRCYYCALFAVERNIDAKGAFRVDHRMSRVFDSAALCGQELRYQHVSQSNAVFSAFVRLFSKIECKHSINNTQDWSLKISNLHYDFSFTKRIQTLRVISI